MGGGKKASGWLTYPQNGFCQEWISPGFSSEQLGSGSQGDDQLMETKFSTEFKFTLLSLTACSSPLLSPSSLFLNAIENN